MLLKSRLAHFGSCIAVALLLTSCFIEDPRPDEREKVELETWSHTPASSTYTYAKCESFSAYSLTAFCTQNPTNLKTQEQSPYTHNWNTNCKGDGCATVWVFAHYMLPKDLGPGQTLRIEAFDNPQFRSSPVASLELVGFDTSHPNSTNEEAFFLAPGEYYFRAYLTYEGDSPTPYPFHGMDLVGGRPVGFFGALSGAKRVLIESTDDKEIIHITIDQLYEKPQPEEDSLAKLRLQISVDPDLTIPTHRDIHVVLSTVTDLEATPAYDFTVSTNELLIAGQENETDFVSPSLTPGSYYVFTYIDANGNGFADKDEAAAFVLDGEDPALVKVEKNRTRNAKVQLLDLD